MIFSYKGWKQLFLICLGLFAGTAFCMKWMEADFIYNDSTFTIIGLEISYPEEKVREILSGLDYRVHTILSYHLYFDFAFMAGVYPGIAALCMMARDKVKNKVVKRLLLMLACLQVVALGCDIAENRYLLTWLNKPVNGNEFQFYHIIVFIKWAIALAGALLAIPLAIIRKKIIA